RGGPGRGTGPGPPVLVEWPGAKTLFSERSQVVVEDEFAEVLDLGGDLVALGVGGVEAFLDGGEALVTGLDGAGQVADLAGGLCVVVGGLLAEFLLELVGGVVAGGEWCGDAV